MWIAQLVVKDSAGKWQIGSDGSKAYGQRTAATLHETKEAATLQAGAWLNRVRQNEAKVLIAEVTYIAGYTVPPVHVEPFVAFEQGS